MAAKLLITKILEWNRIDTISVIPVPDYLFIWREIAPTTQ